MTRECRELERDVSMEEVIDERGTEKALNWLRNLERKRKEKTRGINAG